MGLSTCNQNNFKDSDFCLTEQHVHINGFDCGEKFGEYLSEISVARHCFVSPISIIFAHCSIPNSLIKEILAENHT